MRAVVWYTGKEFLRKKILYVIMFIAIVLLLGAVIAGQLALSEQTKIIQDISWGVIEISGLVVALFF